MQLAGPGRTWIGSIVLVLSVLAVFSVVWAGCSTMQVSADFRRNFRFASVETYAWLPDPPGHAGDPVLHNDLIDGRVRDAVNRELQAMGYRKVSVDDADLHVTYYLGLETRVNMRMVTNVYQYRGGFFDHHSTQTALREYERGTLLIDLLEAPRRRLVWRGTAAARVRRRSDPEEREQKINDAVEKTLAQFPPGGPQFRPAARS
jgi:hypothetical protein